MKSTIFGAKPSRLHPLFILLEFQYSQFKKRFFRKRGVIMARKENTKAKEKKRERKLMELKMNFGSVCTSP